MSGLGWKRAIEGIPLPNRTTGLRDTDFPTWSWASISAPIQYENMTLEIDTKFLRSDVRPELKSAPYGTVTGKTLILSASMLRVEPRDMIIAR